MMRVGTYKNKFIIYVFFTITVIFSPEYLNAEKAYTLKEAIEIAIKENHHLRAAGMNLRATEEDISIARSYLLPQLRIEERFMRTDNPAYVFSTKINQERFTPKDLMGAPGTFNNPEPISNFQTVLSVEMPIYVRRAWIGLEISKREYQTASKEFERKKEEIVFEVIRAYLGVRTAKEYVNVAKLGLENAEEHLRIAKKRAEAGLGLQSDVLRAEVGVADAKARLISAEKNLMIAKRALGLLMGLDESVDITDGIDFEHELLEESYYVERALQGKEIKAMELRYENAKRMVSLERSDYIPQIGIGAQYELDDPNTPFGSEGKSWQVMAFLRWDIFSGWRTRAATKKAEYKLKEAGEYLDGLKKSVKFRVHETYSSVLEARANLELARSALEAAQEGRRLIKIRYENNLARIVDLLDSQTALDNARAQLVHKEGSYYEAIARLLFVSNMMDEFIKN
ncbi:MAG: TolC family protein [Thermodesulfovibrionales bacterium]|nr:TolC family protein [Thermodesulfovibrionales bacterium]